jgi:hypothetical protein
MLFDSFKSGKSEGNIVGRSGTIFRVSLSTQPLVRTPLPEDSYVVDIGKKTRTVVP